jgi:hypothetical protein
MSMIVLWRPIDQESMVDKWLKVGGCEKNPTSEQHEVCEDRKKDAPD